MALACVAGCMSYNVQTYGSFDASDKTITVSQGGRGLAGAIKARLHNAGWTLVVDRGPVVTQGTVGAETLLETGSTFRSRYRMNLEAYYVDISITGGRIYNYDISIVDNLEGAEVLTMNGRGIDSTIVDELMQAIQEQTL